MSNNLILNTGGGTSSRNLENLPSSINSIAGGLTPLIVVTTDGTQVYATKGGTRVDGVLKSDGKFYLNVSLGTWTVTAVSGSSRESTVQINSVARIFISIIVNPLPVGGRIYYVDSTATGGEYHFYDANYNELTTHTVDGLANATYYYTKSKANKDKFYIYATTDGSPSGSVLHSDYLQWGEYGMLEGTANTRGSGKTNSAMLLNRFGSWSDTIWNWLKGQRNSNLNGCNDWFIGSTVELDDLRTGSTPGASEFNVGVYYNIYWASAEARHEAAYQWRSYEDAWDQFPKDNDGVTMALRSF